MNDQSRPLEGGAPAVALKLVVAGQPREALDRIAGALRARERVGTVAVGECDLAGLPLVVARTDPDLLILVAKDAGTDLLHAVERLGHLYAGMTPILLCDDHSPEFLVSAMRAGVREVLPFGVDVAELQGAVDRVDASASRSPIITAHVLAFCRARVAAAGRLSSPPIVAYALAAEEGSASSSSTCATSNGAMRSSSFRTSGPRSRWRISRCRFTALDPAFLSRASSRRIANLGVLAAPEDPVHALDVKPEHIDVLIRIARSTFDFVILDAGRALDAVTVRALDYADVIFPVMQLTVPFIRDGKRLLAAFRSLDYPVQKVRPVVNRYEKGGDISLKDMEQALGTGAYRTFPNDHHWVAKAFTRGVPVVALPHGSAISRSLREVAHALVPFREAAGRRFNRMLHRTYNGARHGSSRMTLRE